MDSLKRMLKDIIYESRDLVYFNKLEFEFAYFDLDLDPVC